MPADGAHRTGAAGPDAGAERSWIDAVVWVFLKSDFSLLLLLLATALGVGALLLTPREEDPQIVVPLADVLVSAPGLSAEEVEKLVATPLERLLFQIDGVEYVYSSSAEGRALVTVRFYVGEDRERSLVKLFKRIDENLDVVPPAVTGWVVKPVEIDDVPILTLTLRSATAEPYLLRRVAEELAARLAANGEVSRVTLHGGPPRAVRVELDPEGLLAHGVTVLDVENALRATNVSIETGEVRRDDRALPTRAGRFFVRAEEVEGLVVGVFDGRPVRLAEVARVQDGPDETVDYVRHGFGPARGFAAAPGRLGTFVGPRASPPAARGEGPVPAVTIAFAKKKGTNAVRVARSILEEAENLRSTVVPDDMELVVTRNAGWTADEKVNDLVESLAVAIFIVLALLGVTLGWRQAVIVCIAVPVVFGLTLAVNQLAGFTINRVTLFALILSLGLLVDDPIVDVENVSRHFERAQRAGRRLVIAAVREIRPPLISATLAVIVSFLPMFFITGMMGPYMRPMALNVPVAMLMSMLVAFTITPWLCHRLLGRGYAEGPRGEEEAPREGDVDEEAVRRSFLYRIFRPLMLPLLRSRRSAWGFLLVMAALTAGALSLAAVRGVPLKMLPYDDKDELLLVLDYDEGTTLERNDACVRRIEEYLARVPEVTDFTSYVGIASPMDFNGMVRHYYLRRGDAVADVRVNLVHKKNRRSQSHAVALRLRDDLEALARAGGANLKIVEIPPGPPVLQTLVAEVRGQPGTSYDELVRAARVVRARMEREPGVVDADDSVEADRDQIRFDPDREKAAIGGVSVADVSHTLRTAITGARVGTLHAPGERRPVPIRVRLPQAERASAERFARLRVRGRGGDLVPLLEIGRVRRRGAERSILHKNLTPVVYVLADVIGRAPAEAILDIEADRRDGPPPGTGRLVALSDAAGWVADQPPRPLAERTFLANGGGIPWGLPKGISVTFAGEGEWDITLDVFRDLGLAFGAALLLIYVILVAQTGSFLLPVVVMLAIPLTIPGILPGFRLLNALAAHEVGGIADPVFFTATGMIGMIALAGIVTRDSIILVDFVHHQVARGRRLVDAILISRVVRLRPILLTAATAMLSAAPITLDPIFSGLAWSLIFGLLASTVFTLFVVPVVYWLLYEGREARGG